MTPVTIGDQKFVKDLNKGWIDSKTKQPADKGLIRLLDTLIIDEPVLKKLRTKIDKRVEPITLNGQKFVYDVNQGWVDDKTKTPVPPSLQRTLSNAVPRFGKDDTADIDVTAGFGIVGQAAQQQTKAKPKPKTGGGTLVNNRNTRLNKPLVAMINQLASIDGFLKQRLDNQKIVAKNNLLAIRESQIEATDQAAQMEVIQPDAEKVSGSSAGLVALGGLALLTLDPVQEAIKDIAHGIVETGKFITNVVSTINKAFAFLFSGKSGGDEIQVEQPQPVADAQSTNTQTETPVKPEAIPEEKSSFSTDVAAGAATGALVGSVVPRVGMVVGGVVGGIVGGAKHFVGGGSTTPAASSGTGIPTAQATKTGGSSATSTTTPATSSGTGTPTAQATKTGGSSATSTTTPVAQATQADAAATGEIPKNNIVALGKYLQGQGIKVSEHPAFGGVGKHGTNSRHYSGNAIDLNIVAGRDVDNPAAAAKLDALKPQLEAAGYNVIWRAKDHYDHMHVSVGGPEGRGSYGDSNSLMGMAGQAVENGLEKMAELFGMLGSAIVKPGVPRDKADYSQAINAAAVKTNAEVATTKTPKSSPTPKLPTPPNINKIDGGATQNPATNADKNSVYYYLRRFGFQDLNTPDKALIRT